MSAAAPRVYLPAELRFFAAQLFGKAGMDVDKAETVADILVEADALGHDTHGLELVARYLSEIETGSMTTVGEPETISDRGAAITWNGLRLPGPWLMMRALEMAFARVSHYGTIGFAIGNAHHIGCQAAYLQRAAQRLQYFHLRRAWPRSRPSGASGLLSLLRHSPLVFRLAGIQ